MVPFRRLSQRQHVRDSPAWLDDRDTRIVTATFPIHPLPSMQASFEESMVDATGQTGHVPFPAPSKTVKARQQSLCRDQDAKELSWNYTYACHWRHFPRGKFHPLLKTTAQIVFGVHLLHQRMEKSVADVADILLKHVNELDSFLQRANEDLESSLKDMLFRRKCLKVPMEHVNEFDRLLEDRNYRAQLLDGNITIERTTTRMNIMLDDYLADMNTLRDANHKLNTYLQDIGQQWTCENEDVARIYSAMCGNTGGWSQFLQSLAAKAEKLAIVLVQVSSYCNEIEKRCGAASRRSLIATRSSSRNSSNSRENPRGFRNLSHNKPLPTVPSERPPYKAPSSANSSGMLSDAPTALRLSTIRAIPQSQSDSSINSNYIETRRWNGDSTSSPTPYDYADTQHRNTAVQPDHRTPEHRGRPISQTESHEPLLRAHRTASSPPEPQFMQPQPRTQLSPSQHKFDNSPAMPCQDSAYSSVSSASVASPTIRPASSLSSQPHFGLFPSTTSNSSHTARNSISGRSSTRNSISTTALPMIAPEGLNVRDGGNRKLNKRSSFSSFKQLFGRKKKDRMGDIVE